MKRYLLHQVHFHIIRELIRELGPVNHIISSLEDQLDDETFKDFMNGLNIVKEEYFHKMEGNECSKVLKGSNNQIQTRFL